ncbi:hypothetical protein CLCR_03717 [Cladophialophora carrionii]|uniref:Uncharacterized protein n=1 Tax=Cladophialophora carrionii TaxID=86049 RepID=A0A1C1CGM1_9EURO|nr:hypothetical protein CLCR_03717 [Cladophialophora carrionii]
MPVSRTSTQTSSSATSSSTSFSFPADSKTQKVLEYSLKFDVLKGYLERTYPNQYELKMRLGFFIIKAPEVLSEAVLDSLRDESSRHTP